jgi:hypothetical protein
MSLKPQAYGVDRGRLNHGDTMPVMLLDRKLEVPAVIRRYEIRQRRRVPASQQSDTESI